MAGIPGIVRHAQDRGTVSQFRLTVALKFDGIRPPRPAWIDTMNCRTAAAHWEKIYWATPPWLTRGMFARMKAIYRSAGPTEHVDHIIPLKNPLVCGLHVPWNLQVMNARKNMQKSNTWWPDHPFESADLFPPIHDCQKQIALL